MVNQPQFRCQTLSAPDFLALLTFVLAAVLGSCKVMPIMPAALGVYRAQTSPTQINVKC